MTDAVEKLADRAKVMPETIVDAMRANPVGASLIGMGLVWLLAGARTSEAVLGAARAAAGSVAPGRTARQMSDLANEGVRQARDAAGQATDMAQDALQDTLQDAGETAAQLWRDQGAPRADEALRTLRGARATLGRMIDEQPLWLAAGGLALGAAIAASLPSSGETRPSA